MTQNQEKKENVESASSKTPPAKTQKARRLKKAEGRKKRVNRLKTEPEFAKKYFEGKAKRSEAKKKAFRQKKSKKK